MSLVPRQMVPHGKSVFRIRMTPTVIWAASASETKPSSLPAVMSVILWTKTPGVKYHHIIDPKTGYSANNGLISVTIVSADSTLADGLSTSLFVLGTQDAIAYCRSIAQRMDLMPLWRMKTENYISLTASWMILSI